MKPLRARVVAEILTKVDRNGDKKLAAYEARVRFGNQEVNRSMNLDETMVELEKGNAEVGPLRLEKDDANDVARLAITNLAFPSTIDSAHFSEEAMNCIRRRIGNYLPDYVEVSQFAQALQEGTLKLTSNGIEAARNCPKPIETAKNGHKSAVTIHDRPPKNPEALATPQLPSQILATVAKTPAEEPPEVLPSATGAKNSTLTPTRTLPAWRAQIVQIAKSALTIGSIGDPTKYKAQNGGGTFYYWGSANENLKSKLMAIEHLAAPHLGHDNEGDPLAKTIFTTARNAWLHMDQESDDDYTRRNRYNALYSAVETIHSLAQG